MCVVLIWVMCDPYSESRDKRGRFTEGNVGRLRGTFTWLSGEGFKEKYPFLNIVVPDVCPRCGGLSYRFNVRFDDKNSYIVRCKCNHCGIPRSYHPYREEWSGI